MEKLTLWGRVTHICVSKLTIIGSDNGLSPGRRQAIIWTNAKILLIRHLGTNFNEISIEILSFSFITMRLKVSSAKWRPFCLGLNVLTQFTPWNLYLMCLIGKILKCIWQFWEHWSLRSTDTFVATQHIWILYRFEPGEIKYHMLITQHGMTTEISQYGINYMQTSCIQWLVSRKAAGNNWKITVKKFGWSHVFLRYSHDFQRWYWRSIKITFKLR